MSARAESTFVLNQLPVDYNDLAPDGSEIRWLTRVAGVGMMHCTLRAGASAPVAHRTVEEIWYFLSGTGEVWRRRGDAYRIDEVFPGVSLTIPPGTSFQFRTLSDEPLCFLVATIPPWPGGQEAVPVPGCWPAAPW